MEDIYLVYVTTANKEEAEKIAKNIISKRLAACANILDNISSLYWWEGKVRSDNEAVLILKTREGLMEKVEKEIINIHSYDNPCIVFLPVDRVTQDFKNWIFEETNFNHEK